MKKSIIALLIAIVFSMMTSGCLTSKSFISQKDRDAFVTASRDIGKTSVAHLTKETPKILNKLLNDLSQETRSIVKNEITDLSNNLVHVTGSEAKCTLDVVKQETIAEITEIFDNLMKKQEKKKPIVCAVNPPIIKNSRKPRIEEVSIYGYDLNTNTIKVKYETIDGKMIGTLKDGYISKNSDYRITIRLTDKSGKAMNYNGKFTIYHNEKVISEFLATP